MVLIFRSLLVGENETAVRQDVVCVVLKLVDFSTMMLGDEVRRSLQRNLHPPLAH